MAVNTLKCNNLTPLGLKGLTVCIVLCAAEIACHLSVHRDVYQNSNTCWHGVLVFLFTHIYKSSSGDDIPKCDL